MGVFEMILADPGGFEYFGVAFDLLEVAVLPELEVDLVLGAFLYVQGLIELALRFVLAYVRGEVQGGGRSFTFLMCWSRKEPFLVAGWS
jgi:hypothetical protein